MNAKLLFLCFLLLSLTVQAQEIPKGANVIMLTTTLSDSALVDKAVGVFNEQGYVVDKTDYRLGSIVTESKAYYGAYKMRILGNVKSGVLSVRG